MKENSMQEYEIQRNKFFPRKSLSCKWRGEFGEAGAVGASVLWAEA